MPIWNWRRCAISLLVVLSASCADENGSKQPSCPLFNPPNEDSSPLPLRVGGTWSYAGTHEEIDSNGSHSGTLNLSITVMGSRDYAGRPFHHLMGDPAILPDLLRLDDQVALAAWSSDTLAEPPIPDWAPFWNARRQSLPWPLFDFSADSGTVVVLFSATWPTGMMRYEAANHGYAPMSIGGHYLPKVFHFDLRYTTVGVAPYDSESRSDDFFFAPGIGLVRHREEWNYRGPFNTHGSQQVDLQGCDL